MNISLLLAIIFLICIITLQIINENYNNIHNKYSYIENFNNIAYDNIPKMSQEQDISMKQILQITHKYFS